MKKLVTFVAVVALVGCAKTGRAWVMDNSPYLDMLYEGTRFHIGGLLIGGLVWWWLNDNWRYQGTNRPFLAGAAFFCILSGIGLYRGYDYIHSSCTWDEVRTNNCPNYKLKAEWPVHYRDR